MAKTGRYRGHQLKAVNREALARHFVKVSDGARADDEIYEVRRAR